MKKSFIFVLLFSFISISESTMVRFKDVSRIIESWDNQLIGYGLLLDCEIWDTQRSAFTEKRY